MILDVKLKKSINMFCDESAAATVATWLGRHYEMMFANMVGFQFDVKKSIEDKIIGPNIYSGVSNENIFKLLAEYHGIRTCFVKPDNADAIGIITAELEKGMPILVLLREKYCSWIDSNSSTCVVFLVIGYDNEYLFGYDIHSNSRKIVHTAIKEVRQNNADISEFGYTIYTVVSKERDVTRNDILKYICKGDYFCQNSFDQMRDLAECIKTNLDYEIERMDYDIINEIPLLQNIMHVLRARKLFASTCEFVAHKNGDEFLNKVSLGFLRLGGEWNTAWNMLLKFFYSEKDYGEQCFKISEKITNISYMEEELFHNLVSGQGYHETFVFKGIDRVVGSTNKLVEKEINLKHLYNNKAFEETGNDVIKADLTGYKEYFLEGELARERVIKVFDLAFLINNGLDNVSCKGQSVKVSEEGLQKIYLLGCAEWGEGSGNMEISYADGHVEYYYIVFKDWFFCDTDDMYVAWKGKAQNSLGKVEERALFCISIKLEHKGKIQKIKLPSCNNMHIFGMKMVR